MTKTEKAIQHIARSTKPLTTREVADAVGTTPHSVYRLLTRAKTRNHGRLKKHTLNGAVVWSYVDEAVTAPDDELETVTRWRKGRAYVEPEPEQPSALRRRLRTAGGLVLLALDALRGRVE
jgi:DNA-binding CsgD family transcriptional regulator